MFDEFRKSLKASLYERTASPIIGAFVSAWLILNWKLCLIVAFADDTIYERLAYIEKSPYIDIWPNLYFPLVAAAIFIGLYPLASLLPYKWWEWYAKKKAEIKNSMQRGVLISLEKSMELRNEIDNQEVKFEEMLKGKEQKNAELLVMHDNLLKICEEKELEIKRLEQQLKKPVKSKSLKEKHEDVGPENTWPFPSPKEENENIGGFVQDPMKKTNALKAITVSEKSIRESEWDEEFNKIVMSNSRFPQLFDEALVAAVNPREGVSNEAKKVCLVHGVIELSDTGKVKMTEKGQYLAKKIV